jgi:hypothetical protein
MFTSLSTEGAALLVVVGVIAVEAIMRWRER